MQKLNIDGQYNMLEKIDDKLVKLSNLEKDLEKKDEIIYCRDLINYLSVNLLEINKKE